MGGSISNNKRIAKNTIMLYIRMILVVLVNLYTSRIVLEVLGVDDYGVYNVVGGLVVSLSFLSSAMTSATQRYISFELGVGDKVRISKVFNIAVINHFIIALVVVLLAEFIGVWYLNYKMNIAADRLVAANWVYQLSLLTYFVKTVSIPYNAIIISHERMNVFALVSIIEVLLILLLTVLLNYITLADKLILYALLMFSVQLVIRAIYQIYCRVKFSECKFILVWDKVLIKEMLFFSGWSLFGNMGVVSKTQGVNLVLNIFFGTVINAAWGIASQVVIAANVFIANFTTALSPSITKSYANGEYERTKSLLFTGMKMAFFLSSCFVIPILINTPFILSIWLKEVPDHAILFTQYMLVTVAIESIVNPIVVTLQATGKIRLFQILIGIIYFLNIPMSYIVLKFSDNPTSIFFVVILLAIVALATRLILLHRQIKFSVPILMKILGVNILIYLFNGLFVYIYNSFDLSLNGFTNLIVTTVISILITVVVFYIFGLSKSEKGVISNKIGQIRRKFIG